MPVPVPDPAPRFRARVMFVTCSAARLCQRMAEIGLLLTLLMIFNKFGALIAVPALAKVLRPRFLLNRRSARVREPLPQRAAMAG